MCGISTHAVIIEPLILWADEAIHFHRSVIEPDYLAGLPKHEANDAGTKLVKELASALKKALMELGCTYLQIGAMDLLRGFGRPRRGRLRETAAQYSAGCRNSVLAQRPQSEFPWIHPWRYG